MPRLSEQQARQRAYRIVASQLAVTGIVALLFFLLVGRQAGLSAAAGGAINAAGTCVQVWIVFMGRAQADPKRAARVFFRAEAAKIVVIVALFALTLRALEFPQLPMIIGFAATLFVFLAALLVPLPDEKHG